MMIIQVFEQEPKKKSPHPVHQKECWEKMKGEEGLMNTLIVYATKYGSVQHAAQLMASRLGSRVKMVNVKFQEVPPIEDFELVILGGSIYGGKIQPELTRYMEENLQLLLKKRIGLFICAAHPNEGERERELNENFPSELYAHATAREVVGYEIHYKKMSLFEKWVVRLLMKTKADKMELSDGKIRKFAKELLAG